MDKLSRIAEARYVDAACDPAIRNAVNRGAVPDDTGRTHTVVGCGGKVDTVTANDHPADAQDIGRIDIEAGRFHVEAQQLEFLERGALRRQLSVEHVRQRPISRLPPETATLEIE